jgi:predicted metal-binding membrane protein
VSPTGSVPWRAGRLLRRFLWLHPEWWSAAICAVAWIAMALHGFTSAAHRVHHGFSYWNELLLWLLMIAAMMLPVMTDAVRTTAARSLWRRRHRAIAGFLVGYFAPWLALGALAAGLRSAAWTHADAAAALGFCVAVVWQSMPPYRRAVIACERRLPLAPDGWRADRDCLRFGGAIGLACVASCWALMLGCALSGHGIVAMAGGMAVTAVERRSFRPRPRTVLALTLALAGYYFALAVRGPRQG